MERTAVEPQHGGDNQVCDGKERNPDKQILVRGCEHDSRISLKEKHNRTGCSDRSKIVGLRQQCKENLPVSFDHTGEVTIRNKYM